MGIDTGSTLTVESPEVRTDSADESKQPSAAGAHLFALLLLLSGFCGISYEILYGRVLGNLIGDQMVVSASILMTFLLGIGFGTLYAHRLWRHLWLIEAGIGVCSVAFALGTAQIDALLYAGLPFLGAGIVSSILACTILLATPAFLIGCTLPLFVGYMSRVETGVVFAKAYTVYNFGAALTALLIEFWILRALGLKAAMLSIAALNFVVAAMLRTRFAGLRDLAPEAKERVRFPITDKFALVAVSLGSAIFQLLMIKSAECLLGPFRESFALVLTIVLAGIAAGAALTKMFRLDFFAVLMVNLVALCWFLGGFGFTAEVYAAAYESASESYWMTVALKLVTLVLIMGVPAMTFGATIPSLLTVQKNAARESGELLFVSSIANAGGFLIMVLVLHRWLDYGVITLVVAGLVLTALVIKYLREPKRIAIAAGVFGIAVVTHANQWDEDLLYLGHTAFHAKEDLAEAREELSFPEKFKGYQDVFSINWRDGRPYFFINGYQSIPLNSPSEKLVGAFSSLFSPRLDEALVLGVGSGATAGTVGRLFEKTDAVEINAVVLANLFRMKEYNFGIEDNPGVNIIHDDAIHFTKSGEKRYSLIINTVTTPLYFSSSKLYTHEFLESASQRLVKGGIYVTWVDSRVGDRGIDIILSTIKETFPHCAIGCIKASYFMVICSDEPIRVRQPNCVAEEPVLNEYFLKDHDLYPAWMPYGLLTDDAFSLIGDESVPHNTLDYPSLEFAMARLRKRGIADFKKRLVDALSLEANRSSLSPEIDWNGFRLVRHLGELLGGSSITRRWEDLAEDAATDADKESLEVEIEYLRACAEMRDDANSIYDLASHLELAGRHEDAIQQFERVVELDPDWGRAHVLLGKCLAATGRNDEAIARFRAGMKANPNDEDAYLQFGLLLLKLNRAKEAITFLDEALRRQNRADLHIARGRALEALNRRPDARKAYLEAIRLDRRNKEARELLKGFSGLQSK